MGPTFMSLFASNMMLPLHTCFVGYKKWVSILLFFGVSLPCKPNSTNFKIIN